MACRIRVLFIWLCLRGELTGSRFFSVRGVEVLLSELRWVWMPTLSLAAMAAWRRCRSDVSRDRAAGVIEKG